MTCKSGSANLISRVAHPRESNMYECPTTVGTFVPKSQRFTYLVRDYDSILTCTFYSNNRKTPLWANSIEGDTMENAIADGRARPMTGSRKNTIKFFAGGAIILAVIAYVTLTSFQSNSIYYYTLQEVNGQRSRLVGQNIRINGPLDKSSIDLDQKNMILKFNMQDGKEILPVVYRGVVPDTLTNGESVVAEGHLDTKGVFQADTLLVKCPSKYEKTSEGN